MKSDYIWMDGELVPYEDATIHILSPGLHYGLAIFEGIRCYDAKSGPAIFRLREHVERFLNSAHAFGILNFPYNQRQISEAIVETVHANQFSECYIRPLIHMADGPLGLNLDTSRPVVSISTWEWGAYLGEEGLKNGIRMMTSSVTRLHPNVNLTKAKIAGNYVSSVFAKTLALRHGMDEAVMLDSNGFVAECTGENIFVVRDQKIYTPPRATILEGITRDSILMIAKDLGYEVVEEVITRDQLYIADEIFLSGTAAEVTPVAEIDFRKIGSGTRGPITQEIQHSFFETAHGKGTRSAEWLTTVSSPEFSMGI